jgi:RNase P subunit RPR2
MQMRTRVQITSDAHGVSESAHIAHTLRQLEQDIQKLQRIVADSADKSRDEDKAKSPTLDATWQCKKCQYFLGYYDIRSDVLRVRYKEHLMYVRVGQGGFVQVFCRSCGEANTQEYTASAPSSVRSGE